MKLKDIILEEAEPSATSVASIGSIEYQAFPNRVLLYKRDCENNPKCVAKIKREKESGWKFVTTENWRSMNMVHFGNLSNVVSPTNGMKSISSNLPNILKSWGINYDDLVELNSK